MLWKRKDGHEEHILESRLLCGIRRSQGRAALYSRSTRTESRVKLNRVGKESALEIVKATTVMLSMRRQRRRLVCRLAG